MTTIPIGKIIAYTGMVVGMFLIFDKSMSVNINFLIPTFVCFILLITGK